MREKMRQMYRGRKDVPKGRGKEVRGSTKTMIHLYFFVFHESSRHAKRQKENGNQYIRENQDKYNGMCS